MALSSAVPSERPDDPGALSSAVPSGRSPAIPRGDTTPSHRLTLAPWPPSPPSYEAIPRRPPRLPHRLTSPVLRPQSTPSSPSYAAIPTVFPVLRGDPRPPSPAVLTLPRGDMTYGVIPGRRPPPYAPRLTIPAFPAIDGHRRDPAVLRDDPRPPPPSYAPRLTRRSPGRPAVLRSPSYDPRLPRDRRPPSRPRRLTRRSPAAAAVLRSPSYARAPRDAFPVLRGDPPAAPPSYDPRLTIPAFPAIDDVETPPS